MNARLKTVVAAVAIAALASGCGSDEDSTSVSDSATAASESAESSASSSDRAAFIKQAAAACLGAREGSLEKVAAYQKKYGSEGLSAAELARKAVWSGVAATIEAEINALRALEVPAGDEEEVKAILAALQKALDEAKERKKSYDEVEDYFGDADKKLRSYGLEECAKGQG